MWKSLGPKPLNGAQLREATSRHECRTRSLRACFNNGRGGETPPELAGRRPALRSEGVLACGFRRRLADGIALRNPFLKRALRFPNRNRRSHKVPPNRTTNLESHGFI